MGAMGPMGDDIVQNIENNIQMVKMNRRATTEGGKSTKGALNKMSMNNDDILDEDEADNINNYIDDDDDDNNMIENVNKMNVTPGGDNAYVTAGGPDYDDDNVIQMNINMEGDVDDIDIDELDEDGNNIGNNIIDNMVTIGGDNNDNDNDNDNNDDGNDDDLQVAD
eukprot:790323_1